MGSKLSVGPAVRAHFGTFRSDRTGRVHAPDYAIFAGLPAICGFLIWTFGVRLKEISGYLGGIAVFTALLFGLVIFVFQLRLQISSDRKYEDADRLVELIDQLFANVNYAVITGIVTTSLGVVAVTVADPVNGTPSWLSALLAASALHLVLTIFMCVKRIHAAYREISV